MNPTLDQLEAFFKFVKFPTEPIKFSPAETITDPAKFVTTHLDICKNCNPSMAKPYYARLVILRNILAPMPIYK